MRGTGGTSAPTAWRKQHVTTERETKGCVVCVAAAGTLMGRPSWLPVPDFALSALLGEGASVVLEGQCVLPARTQVCIT